MGKKRQKQNQDELGQKMKKMEKNKTKNGKNQGK